VRRGLVVANLVALVLCAGAIAAISPAATEACGAKNACDALLFSRVGAALLAGGDPYAPIALPGVELPFAYPPPALPLVAAWWGALPAELAHVLLAAGSTAALLVAVGRRAGPLVAVAAGIGGWTMLSAYLGQTGMLVGVAAVLLLDPRMAGLALGALLLKPQLGLFALVAFVVAGRWRDVAVAAAVQAGLGIVATVAFGPDVWADWLVAVARPGPARDLALMSNWFAIAPESWRDAAPVVLGGGLALVAGVARRLPTEDAVALALALATVAAPHGHPYDLAVLLAPALALGGGPAGRVLALGAIVQACVWAEVRAPLPLVALALAGACAAPLLRRDRLAASRADR
jgi:hypothetical protein